LHSPKINASINEAKESSQGTAIYKKGHKGESLNNQIEREAQTNMVVTGRKLLWVAFVLAVVVGFPSCPTEARKLAILEGEVSYYSPHFGTLPQQPPVTSSRPSEGPPLFEIPLAPLPGTSAGPHFETLPSGPSEDPPLYEIPPPPPSATSSRPHFGTLSSGPFEDPPLYETPPPLPVTSSGSHFRMPPSGPSKGPPLYNMPPPPVFD
jgi:hypothetical protein